MVLKYYKNLLDCVIGSFIDNFIVWLMELFILVLVLMSFVNIVWFNESILINIKKLR